MANFPTTSIQYGQSGNAVKQLQEFLISQGYSIPAGATGNFLDQTKAALSQWQQANGISSSTPGFGTNWGPQSISKAGGSTAQTGGGQSFQGGYTYQGKSYANGTGPLASMFPVAGSNMGNNSGTGLGTGSSSNTSGTNNSAEIARIQAEIADKQALATAMQKFGITNTDKMMKDVNGNWIPVIDPTNPYTGGSDNTTLLPVLEPGTPEYQAAWDNLSTAYYDILQQELTASTEQQQKAAQYSWEQLRDYTAKTLGFQLSSNVLKAWDEIQGMREQSGGAPGGRNIAGSGMETESIDKYLRNIRLADSSNRLTSKNTIDTNQAKYYQQFATPAQVKALVDSNPSLAASYGLIPSEETKNAMSYSALKAKYPNMSDEEINANIAMVLDEYGNRRSNLYQKYMTGSNLGIDAGNQGEVMYGSYDPNTGKGIGAPISIAVSPGDSGILDIKSAAKMYKKLNTPLANNAAQSGAPIIQPKTTTTATSPTIPVVEPLQTSRQDASSAAAKLGTSGNSGSTLSTPNNPTKNSSNKSGLSDEEYQRQLNEIQSKINIVRDQISKYVATMSGIK